MVTFKKLFIFSYEIKTLKVGYFIDFAMQLIIKEKIEKYDSRYWLWIIEINTLKKVFMIVMKKKKRTRAKYKLFSVKFVEKEINLTYLTICFKVRYLHSRFLMRKYRFFLKQTIYVWVNISPSYAGVAYITSVCDKSKIFDYSCLFWQIFKFLYCCTKYWIH